MIKALLNWGNQGIAKSDVILALLFIALITIQPHYADGPLNLFELGLYLPSIDGVLHGLVPYKDFFYLRGPLEIYIPAMIMKVFGPNLSCLSLYFYLGNVLCLGLACLIGAELLKTRCIFYAFFPILVSRTFPRAVFAFWGGLRYVWGLLFVYLMVLAFKTKRGRYFFLAGASAACAAMTSIEIGVCCFLSSVIVFSMMKPKGRVWGLFALGAAVIFLPFLYYFGQTNALAPFIEDMQAVVFKSHPTFMTYLTSHSPRTPLEFLHAMVPGAPNFQYMTPVYVFLLSAGYLAFYRKSFGGLELSLLVLLVYALVLYMAAFRIIEGGQFETALQAEKILYFFIIEAAFLWLFSRYRIIAIMFLTVVLSVSWSYSINRYNARFQIFKLMGSSSPKDLKALTIDRARGVRTTGQQAAELEAVVKAVGQYTDPQDKIFVYPDMGSYYFLSDRGFAGRFPVATLAWMREDWHRELMQSLDTQKPKLIVLKEKLEDNFTNVYFKRPSNQAHFKEITDFIDTYYVKVAVTPLSGIYLLKKQVLNQ